MHFVQQNFPKDKLGRMSPFPIDRGDKSFRHRSHLRPLTNRNSRIGDGFEGFNSNGDRDRDVGFGVSLLLPPGVLLML